MPKRSGTPKANALNTSLESVIMFQQSPLMVRPFWVVCIPGFYAEVERWPTRWSVRMYGKRVLYHKHAQSQVEATQYLRSFFGREVNWRDWSSGSKETGEV